MRFLLRPLAWLAGLVLLPACWAVAAALGRALPAAFLLGERNQAGFLLVPEGWAFAAGAALYALWHRLRPPEFLYTFAHELTHLVFGLLLGKKVSRFEVSRRSGQVALSGTNPVITLAPYFFPLPAAAVLAAGGLIGWGLGDGRAGLATAFLAGAALALHVTMTLATLRTAQPDIRRSGRFFSWTLIFLAGGVFVGGGALAAAGGAGTLMPYMRTVLAEGWRAYRWGGAALAEGVRWGMAWMGSG